MPVSPIACSISPIGHPTISSFSMYGKMSSETSLKSVNVSAKDCRYVLILAIWSLQ